MKKVVKEYSSVFSLYHYYLGRITVRQAPEPDDIIWENFGLSKWTKLLIRIAAFSVFLIFLGISFTIIIFIEKWRNDNLNDSQVLSILISLLIALVISVINLFLLISAMFFTQMERRITFTSYLANLTFKYLLLFFINSGVLIVIANKV